MERLQALKREELVQKQRDRFHVVEGELDPDTLEFFAESKTLERGNIDFTQVKIITLERPDELR